LGFEPWINDQFTKSPQTILPLMNTIWNEIYALDNEEYGPYALHFNYAWWQRNMTNDDLLRQRVAYSLSQILVTSINSDLREWGESLSSYYDIFVNEAFGNYKDILLKVTKHPAMGYYLSHLNNPREDIPNNIHPDENYAREIMQLFTIGLYQLNPDGTRLLDGSGNGIPTYTNTDIKQLAKVFTGLGGGAVLDMMYCPDVPEFGTGMYCLDKTYPMKMFAWAHEPGSKTFLGHTIPGSGSYTEFTAMAEVDNAVNFLFNHPNTGPFVSYRLIQRLVTSNPSPAYVGRVTAKFNNNGQGIRGDMKAVIKAILLDEEAGSVAMYQNPYAGKLREPFVRYTHVARAFPTDSHRDRYWNAGFEFLDNTRQHVMASPSVFNFYLPDYQPVGDLTAADLVGPEFKIHNTATAIGYINSVHHWTLWNSLMYSWQGTQNNPDGVWILTNELEALSQDSETLINELDKLFTHGQLSDETRQIIRNAVNAYYWNGNNDWRYYRVRLALYLIMISPDYNCSK
ncbi:MAG: DUF1800 domain-containing protein, partial [Saprospiraceae bacterium]|nr:DUF1800 domain-containing protein [Saprospiraceae bacterium]